MATLANDKVWQTNQDNRVTTSGSALTDNRATLLAIKNALLGLGTLPWTVSGSSDSSTSNMSGTDLWAAATNLVFNTTGNAHSWIVLRQTGVATKAEICIDLNAAAANGDSLMIIVSPAAGFGTANGGSSDGSTTTRPTASDEFSIGTSTTIATTWSNATAADRIWNVAQSTDGQCTRAWVYIANVCVWGFRFERAKNPKPGWSKPVFGSHLYGATGWSIIAAIVGAAQTYGAANAGGRLAAFCTAEGYSSGTVMANSTVVDDTDGDWDVSRLGLFCATSPNRGFKGRQFDIWLISASAVEGLTLPLSPATKTHRVVGDLVMPGNGNTPTTA